MGFLLLCSKTSLYSQSRGRDPTERALSGFQEKSQGTPVMPMPGSSFIRTVAPS